MDRNLLNIEFEKTVKLKKVKYDPEKTFAKRSSETKLSQNFAKLAYFFLLLFILIFGAKFALEYTICYIRDEPHKDITKIYAEWRKLYEENYNDTK
jgi:hypothetical protein